MNTRLCKSWTVVLAILSLAAVIAGCAGGPAGVSFEQLFTSPGKYSGKTVTIEAFYFHGWETGVFSEKLEFSGLAPGHLVPWGRMLWVEGGIPKEVFDRLYSQQMMGPEERYGKVRVTGKFEYGGKYGHLGGYEMQLTPASVELLDWTPPR